MKIPYSKPPALTKGIQYILEALNSSKISGDHEFTHLCNEWLEKTTGTKKAFITTSGTHSLEMAAILSELNPGDEVIMPSFTFTSTANAFLLRGCFIKFIDVHPETMNINETLIENAITEKTKVIVPVHYAGVACDMDPIIEIAKKYSLFIVEDAAQAILSYYKGKSLGTIGDFGCLSFHETKNITCGEGGALLINNEKFIKRAEIVREKGTDRAQFFRGEVDKYTWREIGSSYLPSDLNAALLYSQFEIANELTENRVQIWNYYYENLQELEDKNLIELPKIPEYAKKFNAHIFFVKTKSHTIRNQLLEFLKKNGVFAPFHYIPLHSTEVGRKNGEFIGRDVFTTSHSERLLRLPLYYQMSIDRETRYVIECIKKFFIDHE